MLPCLLVEISQVSIHKIEHNALVVFYYVMIAGSRASAVCALWLLPSQADVMPTHIYLTSEVVTSHVGCKINIIM